MAEQLPTPTSQTILVADDSAAIREVLSELLRQRGYQTITVTNGAEALQALESKPVDLVLTDVRMPGMDGLNLLEKIRMRLPDIPVVLLTAWPSVEVTVQALRLGARDFLTKPTSSRELLRVVESQMRLRQFWLEERDRSGLSQKHIQHYLGQLQQAQATELELLFPVLQTLANVLDAREHETQSHSARVSAYAEFLAEHMGTPADELKTIRAGGLMHDIGKIGIPDSILLKCGPLTPEEWAVMKQHPEIGHGLLAGVPGLRAAAGIVLAHHERWDGKGYPKGIRSTAIPFGARVFSIADTMDSMLSNRPYRKALTYSMVRSEVELNRCTQFDSEVVDAFLEIPEHRWVEVVQERCPNLTRYTLDEQPPAAAGQAEAPAVSR